MTTWIIEPRDPLIVRDGRPFGPNPGARAQTLPFPFPTTTTGGVRTRHGQDSSGIFRANPNDVKRIAVRGPLLVEVTDDAMISDWLLPAPADVLVLKADITDPATADNCQENEKCIKRRRLIPLETPAGCSTNLPTGLALVGLTQHDPSKPEKEAPRYWHWSVYKEWLTNPQDDVMPLAALGHRGPATDQRTHVGIKSQTLTNEDGALFQTRGLEFVGVGEKLSEARRLGIAVETEAEMETGIAPLGGERRLMHWQTSPTPLPTMPEQLKKDIVEAEACRIVLLTPAYFKNNEQQGWHPTHLLTPAHGVTPTLKAVSLPRYQVVSGWDFAYMNPNDNNRRGRPKPTRRLAPAGTVFFLKLEGEQSDILQWLDDVWLKSVSDGQQERLDGFGLAVVGCWSGSLAPIGQQKEETL